MAPLALLRRITSSREFYEKVVLSIAAREALPHERQYSSPPQPLVDWAIETAAPTAETARLMREARKWPDMLSALLLDPQAGGAIMAPVHHAIITRELSKRTTRAAAEPATIKVPAAAPPPPTVASTAPAPPAPAAPAGPVSLPPEQLPLGELLGALEKRLRDAPTTELLAAWSQLEEGTLLRTAKTLFREKRWSDLSMLSQLFDLSQQKRAEIAAVVGRSCIYTQDYDTAQKLLSHLASVREADADAQFYASVALARHGQLERSVEFGRRALALRPQSEQFLGEQASTLRRLALAKGTPPEQRTALLEESNAAGLAALQANPARAKALHLLLARNLFDLRRFPEAVAETARLLEIEPNSVDGLMLRSQSFLALNQVKEALEVAERVLRINPTHQGALYQIRSLRTLAENDDGSAYGGSVILLSRGSAQDPLPAVRLSLEEAALRSETLPPLAADAAAPAALAGLDADWILLAGPGGERPVISAEWLARLRGGALGWAGRVLLEDEAGVTRELLRRDLLSGLAESRLLTTPPHWAEEIARHAGLITTLDLSGEPHWSAEDSARRARQRARGQVVVMSKHGIIKFGGGEQFLDSMAEHYEEMGFDPVVVGTRPERRGESGIQDGRAYCFVAEDPAALRRFFLETRPAVVHVLSGLGYQVAAALDYLDIPFIYGVHFWRDCLGTVEGDMQFFLDHDRNPVPRPAFRSVLQRAAMVYSNSGYTQAVLEESFFARTPIIYSLPREVETPVAQLEAEATALIGDLRDFVLLANAKGDKGFDLLLATAQRCPDITFVAISSQSDRAEAEAAVAAAGATNMRILPRTDRIDLLYHRSKVVAVPSYRFVETFSRVCIEAQRFGRPVLGSDRGNVPYLLDRSGVVLPEDPAAWAAELRRIYDLPAHHARLQAGARENSARYSYDLQRRALHGIVSALGDRMLIGVGSGIGNMLHVAPMVRNIARRLGRKVDIVVAEDHQNSLFLLQNDDYVNTAYSLRQVVLRRRYDQVFITHSFGNARVPFQARRTLFSRDWMSFDPGGPFHESVFNLEAARALLQIDYDKEDASAYFVGNYRYSAPPGGRRIGIHGGSKSGFWTSKRWPGYSQLSAALQARGFEVASFGIEAEYVENTLDLTGGTIAEMISRMMTCSYFVSNDSGVMNIANALSIPLTALFGPTNPATRGPLRATSSWLGLTKDCAPCEVTESGKRIFLSGECRCIAELDYGKVEAHILADLGQLGLLAPAGGGALPAMAGR